MKPLLGDDAICTKHNVPRICSSSYLAVHAAPSCPPTPQKHPLMAMPLEIFAAMQLTEDLTHRKRSKESGGKKKYHPGVPTLLRSA
jgi:hypothetical protein